MISKPTNEHKCMKVQVYYTHRIRPICFGNSRGHFRGGTLQSLEKI
jgi:hypothetical protein